MDTLDTVDSFGISDAGVVGDAGVDKGERLGSTLWVQGGAAIIDQGCPVAAGARPPERPRRERILDGAAELFADYGYHGASVRDISGHVGISHSGMLHHFESKEVLLDAVIDRLEEHAQEALDRADGLARGPTAFLNNFLGLWHPGLPVIQLLAMLCTDAVCEDHPGRFRMSRLRRVHEHVLEQCFAQLAQSGQLRTGVDPAFASRVTMDLVLGHAVREKTVRAMQSGPYGDSPLEDITKLLHAFLVLRPDQES